MSKLCDNCQSPYTRMMEPIFIGGLHFCKPCSDHIRDKAKKEALLVEENPKISLIEAINRDKKKEIKGMGPDAPTTVNQNGGAQSHIPYRCDLLPARALMEVSKVLRDGAEKYGDNNWRKVPQREHINHLMAHVLSYLGEDATDDHLVHAACRILFAIETDDFSMEIDSV